MLQKLRLAVTTIKNLAMLFTTPTKELVAQTLITNPQFDYTLYPMPTVNLPLSNLHYVMKLLYFLHMRFQTKLMVDKLIPSISHNVVTIYVTLRLKTPTTCLSFLW